MNGWVWLLATAFPAKHFHTSSSKTCWKLFSEPILIWNVSFVFSRIPLFLLFWKMMTFSPLPVFCNSVWQNYRCFVKTQKLLVVSEWLATALSSHRLLWGPFLRPFHFRIFILSREKKKPREQYAGQPSWSLMAPVPSSSVLGLYCPHSSSLEGDFCIPMALRVGVCAAPTKALSPFYSHLTSQSYYKSADLS